MSSVSHYLLSLRPGFSGSGKQSGDKELRFAVLDEYVVSDFCLTFLLDVFQLKILLMLIRPSEIPIITQEAVVAQGLPHNR
jgi:hypothetical protein